MEVNSLQTTVKETARTECAGLSGGFTAWHTRLSRSRRWPAARRGSVPSGGPGRPSGRIVTVAAGNR
jgi:hypothetical protein